MRQIVLDTETTGLAAELGHRLIEIACVELVNRRPSGRHFHRYLNPERDIDAGAVAVHGITRERLAQAPRFAEIAAELFGFIRGCELIIHNAPFDLGFIDMELTLLAGGNFVNIGPAGVAISGTMVLINSGGASSGASDLAAAVKTAVVNKRAGGMGLISGRKAFQRPMKEGVGILNAIQDVYLDKRVTIA